MLPLSHKPHQHPSHPSNPIINLLNRLKPSAAPSAAAVPSSAAPSAPSSAHPHSQHHHHHHHHHPHPHLYAHYQIIRNKKYLLILSISLFYLIYKFNQNQHHPKQAHIHPSAYSDHTQHQPIDQRIGGLSRWDELKYGIWNTLNHNNSPNGRSSRLSIGNSLKSYSRWFWSYHHHSQDLDEHPGDGLQNSVVEENNNQQNYPNHWLSPTPSLPISSSLSERLESWRSAPLPEPPIWTQFNLLTCPDSRIGKNANYDLLKRAHLMWATMNSTHIKNKRQELIQHLESSERAGLLSSKFFGHGKGIVFTAGNVDTYSRVFLTVRMLREKIGCTLPIEIFSFKDEIPEPELKLKLEKLDVKFKTVDWATKDPTRNKNFHIKASALLKSSFREPLYLDSDNLPAVLENGAIESLWESKGYKKLGALFWPDYWKTHADVPIWLLIGTQCRDEWEQEAGQILIDKSKHLDMLILAEYMLKDWRYWFQISDGDKDVFRYSMLALRKRWALPGKYLGAAGLSWNTLTGYCGHTMLQHDQVGRPLFVHMNLLKQIPSGISRGSTFKRTRTVIVELLKNETEMDYGTEADMLANADETGQAIMDAPGPVRRRAALERGLQPFLHGGGNSAICADVKWKDPGLKPTNEILNWKDPTQIVYWDDDTRLKDFEDRFFDMGGITTAVGF